MDWGASSVQDSSFEKIRRLVMTRRRVTDEQYTALDRRLDEVKRRVDEGTLVFQATMDALQHVVEGLRFETSLSNIIAALKLDWVNPNIEKNFTLAPVRRERKVFRFDLSIASEDAVKKMEKEGWSPANLAELLDYAKSEWNGKGWVVALGSSARFGGGRGVPYLDRYDAKRDLALAWWGNDWDGGCRFLAARN